MDTFCCEGEDGISQHAYLAYLCIIISPILCVLTYVINLKSAHITSYLIVYACNLSGFCAELKQVFMEKLIINHIYLLAFVPFGGLFKFQMIVCFYNCGNDVEDSAISSWWRGHQTRFTKF